MFYYYLAFTQTKRIFFFGSWFFFVITPDEWGFYSPFLPSTQFLVSDLSALGHLSGRKSFFSEGRRKTPELTRRRGLSSICGPQTVMQSLGKF